MKPTEANQNRLAKLLGELEQELARADSLDDVARERMRSVHTALARALEGRDDTAGDNLGDLTDPVQRSIDEFEKSHPRLTLTLGRILDTLNKIGV